MEIFSSNESHWKIAAGADCPQSSKQHPHLHLAILCSDRSLNIMNRRAVVFWSERFPLNLQHSRVESVRQLRQLTRSSLLPRNTIGDHHDLRCILDCGQAMCNHNGCAGRRANHLVESSLYNLLTLHVQGACGFIQ